MAETSAATSVVVKPYINSDVGYKIPVNGDTAPKGPYDDFRAGVKVAPSQLSGDWGAVTFDGGMWEHFPMNAFATRKLRWWLGINYLKPEWANFFAAARIYRGQMPANDASMVAAAGVVGVNSHLFGPISTEVSAFGVFKEAYYNAPIDSAKFYIGTIGPNAQFGPLNIKALAQIWYVEAGKGPVTVPTTYAQLGAGATVSF